MNKMNVLVAFVAAASLSGAASANLLTNGGFETGDLTGWNEGPGTKVLGAPSAGAFEGNFALEMTEPAAGVPEVNQGIFESGGGVFPASPGQEFNLSGYMLTENALPGGPVFGLLKIVFEDAAGNDLEPASVSIGQAADPAFPGAESLPFANLDSTPGEWFFTETQAVAPAGTASVGFLALVVDFGGGNNPIWFDNIVATPEPTSLIGLALVGLAALRRR